MDKFAWHLPLYRQHQCLTAAGMRVSRQWLTQLAQATISLMEAAVRRRSAALRLG